ncbi:MULTISPECIES: hypothetical protein [unclassified Butyrivibrio]|uniref:hypothetical protein n=1 Tax=unclassified Butyrivibrio TaxID=2639466 RepID=UPI0003B5E5C9|nr:MULTISPECIES: hypothetical protein [unclassified Butyrivibrio]MDC7293749.1 hypothetical protein [Butyrivibrio sp. DSM 10294]
MKKRIFSILAAMGIALFFTLNASVARAADPSVKNITIESEYMIPDDMGWCTYYVLIATNNTGKDISVSADFTSYDKAGKALNKVNDYSEAVKKGQRFILYGQFVNSKNPGLKSCKYEFSVKETGNCTYSSVNLDASKNGNCLEVSATNYSEKDIQGVGVRTVFLKNGKPVAFDVVNIADTGYTFHGGSTNSQAMGVNAGEYDEYIMTYTSAGNLLAGNF